VLTKEAHHKRHSLVGFVAAVFKRCASFVSTSYALDKKIPIFVQPLIRITLKKNIFCKTLPVKEKDFLPS